MTPTREDLRTPEQLATLRTMFADGRSDGDIAQAVGRTALAIEARRCRLGLSRGHTPRPMPDGFADDLRAGMTRPSLKAKYRVGVVALDRWRLEVGVIKRPYRARRDAPADFVTRGPTMTRNEASKHYDQCEKVIARWYAGAGIKPKSAWATLGNMGRVVSARTSQGDTSTAGDAAHHLRRFHANVFRCSVLDRNTLHAKGLGDGTGHYSVAGVGIVTVAEMMEMARAKGWGAEAMAA